MYRYILFDFDGTVFDTAEGITKSVRYAINRRGLDAQPCDLISFVGPPLLDEFMRVFGFSHDEAMSAIDDFEERYLPTGLYECKVYDGMRELLEALRTAGYKTGIATSKPQMLAEKLLERENMLGLFDVICGSPSLGNNESKARILSRALKNLGAADGEAVLIGDTKYDVLGARECGIDCIAVRYGFAAVGELEAAAPAHIVESVDALRSLLIGSQSQIM